jgi:Apea-like HEPN
MPDESEQSPELDWYRNPDLSIVPHWAAIAVTGVIYVPVIPLGHLPDLHFVPASFLETDPSFKAALAESFSSFGLAEKQDDARIEHPQYLLFAINDCSETVVRNALAICDMALAIFSKKTEIARLQFLHWDRRGGRAVGVVRENGVWEPILRSNRNDGPAIVFPPAPDFWDTFLGNAVRSSLSELDGRLFKCLEWEREAEFSPHITHRFAFLWIALESMLPVGECSAAEVVRRLSLVAFSPAGADSQIIRANDAFRTFSELHPNPNNRKWRRAIEEMYRYRCAILHDGSTDLNSLDISPQKIQWFYQLAKQLLGWVQALAVESLKSDQTDLVTFWSNFIMSFLYSEINEHVDEHLAKSEKLFAFDWKNNTWPEPPF